MTPKHRSAEPIGLLRWLAGVLARGPDARFIRHDLDDLYARDRTRGIPLWRAQGRYVRRLLESALSVWRDDLERMSARAAHLRAALRGGSMLQDLRFALRLFRRHPAPAVIAIGGLALAIGVVTAVFSLLDASMLRRYGMDDPKSVMSVAQSGHSAWVGWPYEQFLQMRQGAALGRVEASLSEKVRVSVASSADAGVQKFVLFVSGGYLEMLGGRPVVGRSLVASDDVPGAPAVVVVSHHLWKSELNGDPSAIGKTVWLNGVPFTLVGVLQPDFTGPVRTRQSVWAPFSAFDDALMGIAFGPTTREWVEVTARLTPGADRRAAQDNLTAIAAQAIAPGPTTPARPAPRVQLYSAASPIDGQDAVESYLAVACILGIVCLVLALACANTANLLQAAAVTRIREIGIRLAMGATRSRLSKQLISESLFLGLIAGAGGFLFAIWFVPILAAIVQLSPEINVAPDGRVLAFTVTIALVCGLGAGLSPARHGTRGNVVVALKNQNARRDGLARSGLRTSFVGFQAAVSMLLLVAATLLARTAIHVTHTEIGFDADRILGVEFKMPRSGFDEAVYLQRAVAAVRDVPGVERVSVSQDQPFGFTVEHDRLVRDGHSYEVTISRTDEEYFAAAGLRLKSGRVFTREEVAREAPVALISSSAARAFFREANPTGASLSNIPAEGDQRQDAATIIGVVADATTVRSHSQEQGAIYRPISQKRSNSPNLIVRSQHPPMVARSVEDALRRIDSRVQSTTSIVQERLEDYVGGKRMMAWLSGPIAMLAFALAACGIYGVTAFVVGQRTHEVSVRIAIGASSRDVLRLLVKDSLRPVVIGLGVGLGLALVLSRVSASLLPGVSPHDPVSIGVATMILLTGALAAAIMPARRASKTDPAQLLRHV